MLFLEKQLKQGRDTSERRRPYHTSNLAATQEKVTRKPLEQARIDGRLT